MLLLLFFTILLLLLFLLVLLLLINWPPCQVGVSGNLLVMVVVITRPHMQTTTNMYILNMAMADMLMCLGML